MKIISIINQKGGFGRTTTAINLCGALSPLNRRILLVDLDPQGHASLGLDIREVDRGMTEVLTEEASLGDVIRESATPNLHVAPAAISLSTAEQLLANATHKETRLLHALNQIHREYDYAIIDSPPSLGILTFNALRASNLAIVPIDMGIFSLHGLTRLKDMIDLLRRYTGHQVQLRALVTMANLRTRFAQEVVEEIQHHFDGNVFATLIRNNVRLREAASHGVPITHYDPKSLGALDYNAMAQEVIALEVPKRAETSDLAAMEQAASVWNADQSVGVNNSDMEGKSV